MAKQNDWKGSVEKDNFYRNWHSKWIFSRLNWKVIEASIVSLLQQQIYQL